MTLFDPRSDEPGSPYNASDPDNMAVRREEAPGLHTGEPDSVERAGSPLGGDPITHAAATTSALPPAATPPRRFLPEDLRISWSWLHLLVFIFFTFASFVIVQTGLALYYSPEQRLTREQYERYLLNKPQFLFGSNLLWYAAIFLFLYVTLSVLRNLPFWTSLGWKKLKLDATGRRTSPWLYFFSGVALAIFVAVAGSQVHTKDDMPIQQLLKNRETALLLMAMAVVVAPLVEETVFRGYLYPLFAKSFGIIPGILVTGALFGLMHGAQLGWSWGIVGLLILVGVIFTSARAYTGTVLASFLLHLGYNSAIAITTIVSTHGFARLPVVR